MKINIDKYIFDDQLPLTIQGSFGIIFKGRNTKTNKYVNIKQYDKTMIASDSKLEKAFENEITIMKKKSIDCLLQALEIIETQKYYYCIYDYCEGGNLRYLLKKKKKLPEEEAIKILIDVISGILCLQELKLSNIYVIPENTWRSEGRFKISDFGLGMLVEDKFKYNAGKRNKWTNNCSFKNYLSPQQLCHERNCTKSEIWNIGIIFYEILFGQTPWSGEREWDRVQQILTEKLQFPDQSQISEEGIQFLKGCLQLQEKDRLEWSQLLQSPIFKGFFDQQNYQISQKWETSEDFQQILYNNLDSDLASQIKASGMIVSDKRMGLHQNDSKLENQITKKLEKNYSAGKLDQSRTSNKKGQINFLLQKITDNQVNESCVKKTNNQPSYRDRYELSIDNKQHIQIENNKLNSSRQLSQRRGKSAHLQLEIDGGQSQVYGEAIVQKISQNQVIENKLSNEKENNVQFQADCSVVDNGLVKKDPNAITITFQGNEQSPLLKHFSEIDNQIQHLVNQQQDLIQPEYKIQQQQQQPKQIQHQYYIGSLSENTGFVQKQTRENSQSKLLLEDYAHCVGGGGKSGQAIINNTWQIKQQQNCQIRAFSPQKNQGNQLQRQASNCQLQTTNYYIQQSHHLRQPYENPVPPAVVLTNQQQSQNNIYLHCEESRRPIDQFDASHIHPRNSSISAVSQFRVPQQQIIKPAAGIQLVNQCNSVVPNQLVGYQNCQQRVIPMATFQRCNARQSNNQTIAYQQVVGPMHNHSFSLARR